jgi:hypothetical protein
MALFWCDPGGILFVDAGMGVPSGLLDLRGKRWSNLQYKGIGRQTLFQNTNYLVCHFPILSFHKLLIIVSWPTGLYDPRIPEETFWREKIKDLP